jgi:hypothetical protein
MARLSYTLPRWKAPVVEECFETSWHCAAPDRSDKYGVGWSGWTEGRPHGSSPTGERAVSDNCGDNKEMGNFLRPVAMGREGSSLDARELERRIVDAIRRDQDADLSYKLQYRCPLGNVSFIHLPRFDRDDGNVRNVMLDLFRDDPTLFEAWAEADAESIGSMRIVNQEKIDDQAIGWFSTVENDPAVEVSRRVIIDCLRKKASLRRASHFDVYADACHIYFTALADRLLSEGVELIRPMYMPARRVDAKLTYLIQIVEKTLAPAKAKR